MKKDLVIYYSHEGNTKFVAELIKNKLDADILELKTKKEIKIGNGFTKYLWLGRHIMMKSKPEIEEFDINLDNYENIFLGTPVWAFSVTPPIRTFLDKYKLKNKDMYLFCTNEGSFGKVFKDIKVFLKDNNIISESSFKNVKTRKEEIIKEVNNWLDSLIIK